ncbi:MAG: hypothetical protein WC479_05800 [Candidatus Izemoplasmatales bacterium]
MKIVCAGCGIGFEYEVKAGRPKSYCSAKCGKKMWNHMYYSRNKSKWSGKVKEVINKVSAETPQSVGGTDEL